MKIKCPDGQHKTLEECRSCDLCLPEPIKHTLLKGRGKTRKNKEKSAFGVTSLVENCLRYSYYKLTKELVFDLEKLWIFSRGHAFHAHFEFENKEIFIKKELPDFDIIGFIDAVHNNVLYELKTTANIPQQPQQHHILQAQAYYSLLDKEKQENIKKIILVYLSLHKIKTFEIPKRDIIPFLIARAQILNNAIKRNKLPEREMSWLCKYCDFQDLCDQEKT